MESYEGTAAKLQHELSTIREYLMDSAGQKMAAFGLMLKETRSRGVSWKSFSTLEETTRMIRSEDEKIMLAAHRNDNTGAIDDTLPLMFVDPWAAHEYLNRIESYLERYKS
jgi:hypothetical protein